MTSTPSPVPLTVLISGNGTNFQAIIDSIALQTLPATIIRVISNRKDVLGLERARRPNIPTLYHNLVKYKKAHPPTDDGVREARQKYDAELARLVLADQPKVVVCLGFMHVLSKTFLDPLEREGVRIINLHPALPGAFNGANAIERAHKAWLEGKIDKTGVMIHEVIAEVDMGRPILVQEIPFVKDSDENLEVFEQKVHEIEWGVVVEGINIAIRELREYPRQEHHRYDDKNVLQDLHVYLPRPLPLQESASGYWVIYIHGGAWRDPEIFAPSFGPTYDILRNSSVADSIVGYASINYRLTAHPNFPQDAETDDTNYRNAKHPDHLRDVRRGLAYLQSRYAIGERYILVGHSCGATLAFQTVKKNLLDEETQEMPQPLGIVGVSGIYNLRLLRDTFLSCAVYQEFIEAAFGSNEDIWDNASPAHGDGLSNGWKHGRLALIAHSQGDELVDASQLHAMERALNAWKTNAPENMRRHLLVIDDLREAHDDIWRKGLELAKVIEMAIKGLDQLKVSNP